MSFFDVPIPETPDWEPRYEQPEWAAPPRGVVPGYSAQRAILFKDEERCFSSIASSSTQQGWSSHQLSSCAIANAAVDATEIRQRAKDAEVIWPG